jgi:ribulose-5-phosphate 4-epimerase/fuculose-1-phosphate aldolase
VVTPERIGRVASEDGAEREAIGDAENAEHADDQVDVNGIHLTAECAAADSKIIVTDEEGMEVAAAMGTRPAVLLFGHGAVTASKTLDGAVVDMLGLEEQARMNYLAYAAAGANHACTRSPPKRVL